MIAFIPLLVAVFLTYLCLGLSLAVLPHLVHDTLGYGNLVVGLVIGLQSAAALLSRHRAGTSADLRGARRTVTVGVVACALAGFASLGMNLPALLAGRVLLGVGESFLITGALAWGIQLTGPSKTGRVMAWNGIAMYGAIAAGGPLALLMPAQNHNETVFALTTVLPMVGWLVTLRSPSVAATGRARMPFYRVIHRIWRAGAGLSLGAMGFAGLASFITLHFAAQQWSGAPLVLTTFGAAYIGVRLLFAHLPDRFGGATVAAVSLAIEAAGQVCVWLAPSATVALCGAALTGAGFSLVFPAFGVEAVKRVGPENRGAALGAYVAFFDLSMGLAAPLAGWVASSLGYADVYLMGAATALTGLLLAASLRSPKTTA